jgi:tetratricopeptide (TPR) repeat protein
MAVRTLLAVLVASLALAATAFANADDPVISMNPDFEKGVKAVKAQDYRGAIDLFGKVVATDPKDANAYNYLGYSHRKLGELEPALKHYTTALSLNPDHRGAHEYIGEAYLMLGDVAKAKEHLARLDKICWLGCEEFTDLKKAIREYEARKN